MNLSNKMVKIVLTGNSSVGKTCLIHRIIHSQYIEGFHQTIATCTHDWTANVENRSIDIKIWDTAGQERYRTLAPVYFRDAAGALLVFDASDPSPEEGIRSWLNTFKETAKPDAIIVLTANKADLVSDRTELLNRLARIKDEFGHDVFVTSAKTGENVQQVFQHLANEVNKMFPKDILMASNLHEEEGEFCSC